MSSIGGFNGTEGVGNGVRNTLGILIRREGSGSVVCTWRFME